MMGKKKKIGIAVAVCVAVVLIFAGVYFLPTILMSKPEKREADLATAQKLGDAITEQVIKDHENRVDDYFAGIKGGVPYGKIHRYSFELQEVKMGSTLAKFYGSVPRVIMGPQYYFAVDSLSGYVRVYITDGEEQFLVYPRVVQFSSTSNTESPWYKDNRMTWEEYQEERGR